MKKITAAFKAFCNDESGAAAIEYGILLVLMALAIIGATTTLGSATSNSFEDFSTTLEEAQG